MDGISFRKLADQTNSSPASVWRQVQSEMMQLPTNSWISAKYCERWSGRLNIDGKYVAVKGYDQKIPFIYGIDYLTHDIPVGILGPSENEQIFRKFFKLLKACRYPLTIAICDETAALKRPLLEIYPKARIQLCQNHYIENIRQYLSVRTNDRYQKFFSEFRLLFSPKVNVFKREAMLRSLYYTYCHKGKDETIQALLVDVERRKDGLFAYDHRINQCPHTNNIIKSFNSHLNGRLKTIKGFQSFSSADCWLNAWMIRRRTKAFTDCDTPFKHLNGKTSLELVLKKEADWPLILGVPKYPK